MEKGSIKPEVVAAFAIGLAVGAAGVGLFTFRQIDYEHKLAVRMAGAAQMAQAMGRMDLIQAREAASAARQQAARTAETSKKEIEALKSERSSQKVSERIH